MYKQSIVNDSLLVISNLMLNLKRPHVAYFEISRGVRVTTFPVNVAINDVLNTVSVSYMLVFKNDLNQVKVNVCFFPKITF